MPDNIVPATAHQPDYGALKGATISDGQSVDDVLEQALPDKSTNSALSSLKSLVRQFMLRRDANGLTMVPNTWQAMAGVSESVNSNPQLADAELIRNLMRTALHSGEGTKVGDRFYVDANSDRGSPMGREGAVSALETIVQRRPDLADAILAKNVAEIAANDPDSGVRAAAQNTLAGIVDKRPDLVDYDVIAAVSQAAKPFVGRGDDAGVVVEHTVPNGKTLVGWQFDRVDQGAHSTAQQTLQTIKEKRPDLFAQSVKTTAPGLKQNGASVHTAVMRP